MKKVIFVLVALMTSVGIFAAEDELMAAIRKANTANEKYSCHFEQAKYMKMVAKPIESAGEFYMKGAGSMSMIYTKPEGDLLVITGDDFVMVNNGKTRKHSTKEGSLTLVLRNTLLMSMRGDINGIAKETDADITYTDTKDTDDFEISRRNEVKAGYSMIKLSFDKKTHLLTKMVLEESNGNYTEYELKKYDFSGSFSDDVFALPKK